MKIKQAFAKVSYKVSKHSPAIFTGIGIVGLGATAYLAYKSREKIEAIVVDLEEKREDEVVVDKMKVAGDIIEAVYLPVTVGVVSCVSILMAHKIQNKRIATLAGALVAEQARNVYFEQKYRKKYGDEAYRQFSKPTEEVEVETTGKNGKTKMTVTEVKKDVDQTIGQWYDESSEYASDDHIYNVAFIDEVNDRLQNIIFQRGTLLLNEVRDALGFERTRSGNLLGWTTGDNFEIEKTITAMGNEELGELKEQIYVSWTRPKYIYNDVEFNGRYSVL